jgi:hypothetical protein
MHTVHELLSSIESLSDDQIGRAASSLADHYRPSDNVKDLQELLEHGDPCVASLGAWIFSESANPNKDHEFKNQLFRLLDQTDSSVRLEVIRALSLFASTDDVVVQRIMRMLSDENDAVRHVAMVNLCLFPDESLRSMSIKAHGELVTKGVTKDQIVRLASSESTYDQSAALVGTLRNFGDDEDFVSAVIDLLPRVITRHLSVLPRNGSFK